MQNSSKKLQTFISNFKSAQGRVRYFISENTNTNIGLGEEKTSFMGIHIHSLTELAKIFDKYGLIIIH